MQILNCIFKHLSTTDLVRGCRLVNKQWNQVATEALKKRSDAFVKVTEKTDVEALTACIKSSSNFSFRELELNFEWNYPSKTLSKWLEGELFRQYSSIFTRLRLTMRSELGNLARSFHPPSV